jgi:hypothetical protein
MIYVELSSQNFLQTTEENDENSFGIIFGTLEIGTGHLTVTYNYNRPPEEY